MYTCGAHARIGKQSIYIGCMIQRVHLYVVPLGAAEPLSTLMHGLMCVAW